MPKSDFLKRHTEHDHYGKAYTNPKPVGLGEVDECVRCGKPFVVTVIWAA